MCGKSWDNTQQSVGESSRLEWAVVPQHEGPIVGKGLVKGLLKVRGLQSLVLHRGGLYHRGHLELHSPLLNLQILFLLVLSFLLAHVPQDLEDWRVVILEWLWRLSDQLFGKSWILVHNLNLVLSVLEFHRTLVDYWVDEFWDRLPVNVDVVLLDLGEVDQPVVRDVPKPIDQDLAQDLMVVNLLDHPGVVGPAVCDDLV